jgi:GNAT superfamily N-acetyltransferase
MKTYQQFILEAKQPKRDAVQTISKNLERRTPGMKFHAYPSHSGDIRLHSIEVPKEKQGQGIGSHALKNLTKFADKQNKRVTLTPQADKGKKAKLDKFYKRFGFRSNKGRNKDFSVSDTMIRKPNQ